MTNTDFSTIKGQSWMQLSRHLCIAACFVLSGACSKAPEPDIKQTLPNTLSAEKLDEIHSLFIAAGSCTAVLRRNLGGHGYNIAHGDKADALLQLELHQLRPLRESLPLIHELGYQARYRAELHGANDNILLTLLGQEGSLSFTELCEDIGDEIAGKLRAYLP